MKVTGNQLRAKLQALALVIALAEDQFEGQLKAFPGEDKNPLVVDRRIKDLEDQMARIQVAQMRYNLRVTISAYGQTMTLADGVKRIGGASRSAKRWRSVLPKKDRYRSFQLETRQAGDQAEQWVLAPDTIIELATLAATYAAELQAAIAAGNATEIDLDGLNEADLQL